MPTTSDVLDRKEIEGFKICLESERTFDLRGAGGIGKDLLVLASKDGHCFQSNRIHITDRFDRDKDQLRLEANQIEGLEVLSESKIKVKISGIHGSYWVSATRWK